MGHQTLVHSQLPSLYTNIIYENGVGLNYGFYIFKSHTVRPRQKSLMQGLSIFSPNARF